MLKWIYNKFAVNYDKKVDSIGIAIFRICFGWVLLLEVIDIYKFRHLFFDFIPYLQPAEIDLSFALITWMITLIMLIVGLCTRFAAILNYCFLLVFLATINTYEYHMFYAYMGIGFIWMFMPLGNSLSLDRIILRVRNSNSKFNYNPETKVSRLYYFLPIYVAIGLVYLDSVFYKTTSTYWMEGLGMWRPAVLPHFNKFGNNFTLNSEVITKILGYTTLIFETIFIFLFWFKPFRIPFLIIGLGLHLGILIFFPIPWFALGVSAVYLLLVPVSFWRWLFQKIVSKRKRLTFLYDADCPLCARTKIIIESIDIFGNIGFVTCQSAKEIFQDNSNIQKIENEELLLNIHSVSNSGKIHKGIDTYIQVLIKMWYTLPLGLILMIPGIYHVSRGIYRKIAENRDRVPCNDFNCEINIPEIVSRSENQKILANLTIRKIKIFYLLMLFISLTMIQLMVSYTSGIIIDIRKNAHLKYSDIDDLLESASHKTNYYSKKLLGITHHPVFMDSHMDGYKYIIAVIHIENGKETWLPIVNELGQPQEMIYGPLWVKWTFRVNSPHINHSNLNKGVRDFTAWWIGYHEMDFSSQHFEIRIKEIESPTHFQKDFLELQMNKKWKSAGYVEWKNGTFKSKITID